MQNVGLGQNIKKYIKNMCCSDNLIHQTYIITVTLTHTVNPRVQHGYTEYVTGRIRVGEIHGGYGSDMSRLLKINTGKGTGPSRLLKMCSDTGRVRVASPRVRIG